MSWQHNINAARHQDARGVSLPAQQTSTDLAKQQRFQTRTLTGQKRTFDAVSCARDVPLFHPITTSDAATKTERAPRVRASKIRDCDQQTRHDTASQPSLPLKASQQPLLSLRNERYDLPSRLVDNLLALGITAIYPWQASCLLQSGLLDRSRSLVYTAPTGGGKSLVADIALLTKVVRSPQKKAILVLPYVALVQEKSRWLRRIVDGLAKDELPQDLNGVTQILQHKTQAGEIRVASFYGGSKSPITWRDCDIAVCTIEKANSLVNTAIEDGAISDLGIVVCDELHMLDDPSRGYVYELMLTKLLTIATDVQIVGMSATLSNPEMLANWLKAKFFVAKFRPIPMYEHLVYDNAIYPSTSSKEFFYTASQLRSTCATQKPCHPLRTIDTSANDELKNPVINAVVALAVETAEQGYGALVFTSSRPSAQALALTIATTLQVLEVENQTSSARLNLLADLQALPGGYEAALEETIPFGVGFHHAGLTIEERDMIASAYDAAHLKVMVATCSLAAGINLPARRVILKGARMGRDMVGPAMLRQMRGRAGRKGKDEIGETYLCCEKDELEPVAELLEQELPPVTSCLAPDKRGIKRAILEVVSTGLTSTYEGLQEYVQNSLLWQLAPHSQILDMLDGALTSLLADKMVAATPEATYIPTPLGAATVASGLTPEDGLFVHSDLCHALTSFVMDSELHLFYLFTPIPQVLPGVPTTSDVSWPIFRSCLEALDEPSLRALCLIGISPARVAKMVNSGVLYLPETNAEEQKTARVYRRVYSTFALRDICNEIPIHVISLKYNVPRGTIQSLAQNCHGFAAGMIKFCQRMAVPATSSLAASPRQGSIRNFFNPQSVLDEQASGFSMLAAVLEHMQSRLYAGARADLLELAQVTFVKGRMARVLYEAGFKSVRALAEADPQKDVLPIVMSLVGWKFRAIASEVRRDQHRTENDLPRADSDEHSEKDTTTAAAEMKQRIESEYEMRRVKLEEKLLRKAEIMVRSARQIWERNVMRQGDVEDI